MSNDTQIAAITEFLLARIAEDEAVAQEVLDGGESGRWPLARHDSGLRIVEDFTWDTATVTIDPARVLAECKSKRRIVERAADYLAKGRGDHADEEYRIVLDSMSLPYADHADYRAEWSL